MYTVKDDNSSLPNNHSEAQEIKTSGAIQGREIAVLSEACVKNVNDCAMPKILQENPNREPACLQDERLVTMLEEIDLPVAGDLEDDISGEKSKTDSVTNSSTFVSTETQESTKHLPIPEKTNPHLEDPFSRNMEQPEIFLLSTTPESIIAISNTTIGKYNFKKQSIENEIKTVMNDPTISLKEKTDKVLQLVKKAVEQGLVHRKDGTKLTKEEFEAERENIIKEIELFHNQLMAQVEKNKQKKEDKELEVEDRALTSRGQALKRPGSEGHERVSHESKKVIEFMIGSEFMEAARKAGNRRAQEKAKEKVTEEKEDANSREKTESDKKHAKQLNEAKEDSLLYNRLRQEKNKTDQKRATTVDQTVTKEKWVDDKIQPVLEEHKRHIEGSQPTT